MLMQYTLFCAAVETEQLPVYVQHWQKRTQCNVSLHIWQASCNAQGHLGVGHQ